MPRPAQATSLEERQEHINQTRAYVVGGEPLDAEACVDLMRNPEVILAHMNIFASAIHVAEKSGDDSTCIAPGAIDRLRMLRQLAGKSIEMGYGGNDYTGGTSSDINLPVNSTGGVNGRVYRRRRHIPD